MCQDMCVGMCMDMCIDMCTDMYVDMCIGMCVDMCVDMPVDMHVHGRGCLSSVSSFPVFGGTPLSCGELLLPITFEPLSEV